MNRDPDWWPEWQTYKASQRDYEAAVDALREVGPKEAVATMAQIKKEALRKRTAAFEAFRIKFPRA